MLVKPEFHFSKQLPNENEEYDKDRTQKQLKVTW